jgi:hypothetical protein
VKNRLLIPGGFPPGILELLPSAKLLKNRNRNTLYETATPETQAKCLKSWAPFIDTAFCISAYHISSFTVLDDWVGFFERSQRKVIQFVDALLILSVAQARKDDLAFITSLLETRARKGLPTMLDDGRDDRWEDVYEHIIEVG